MKAALVAVTVVAECRQCTFDGNPTAVPSNVVPADAVGEAQACRNAACASLLPKENPAALSCSKEIIAHIGAAIYLLIAAVVAGDNIATVTGAGVSAGIDAVAGVVGDGVIEDQQTAKLNPG